MTAGNSTYIARGNQRYGFFRSETFNIDNGSGATVDDVIFSNLAYAVEIKSVKAVYVEATDTTGAAAATVSLGTTAGGVDVVAATALEAAKAVGATTGYTIANGVIPAGGTLFARHTGVASTEAGQYYLQIRYIARG
jgi:hypothetical protein